MLSIILPIVLVFLILGAFPSWYYSRGWGYFPSGLLGLILIVTILMMTV